MSHADQLIEIATELAMDAKDNARLRIANHGLERLSSFVSV